MCNQILYKWNIILSSGHRTPISLISLLVDISVLQDRWWLESSLGVIDCLKYKKQSLSLQFMSGREKKTEHLIIYLLRKNTSK